MMGNGVHIYVSRERKQKKQKAAVVFLEAEYLKLAGRREEGGAVTFCKVTFSGISLLGPDSAWMWVLGKATYPSILIFHSENGIKIPPSSVAWRNWVSANFFVAVQGDRNELNF